MVKWKIREYGQQNDVTLDVNPTNYSRSKQVDVVYEQLIDGRECRVVSPSIYKKEDAQLVWASVNQTQLNILMGYINKKVVIVDHLQDDFTAHIDAVEKQYLMTGSFEQRYAVNIRLREA